MGNETSESERPQAEGHKLNRRRRRWIAIAIVCASFGALIVGDWWFRNSEMDALMTSVEASQDSIDSNSDLLLAFPKVLPWTDHSAEDPNIANRQEYERAARSARTQLIVIDDEITTARVLPWHRSVIAARDQYLSYQDAQADFYSELAGGDEQITANAEIEGRAIIAEKALKRGVPRFPQHDSRDRSKIELSK